MTRPAILAAAATLAFAVGAAAQPAPRPAQAPPAAPAPAPAAPTPTPAPPAAAATEAPQTGDRALYQVDGFRSARFNMTEAEVREAINRDFPRAGGNGVRRTTDIESQANRVFRTTALVITGRDLMPDTGAVRIEYILGYQSRRLIQINLIWGTPADQQAPQDVVQTVATRLQAFFARENFPPDSRMAGAVQQDGTIIVFRGRDPQARVVEVIAKPPGAAREGQRPDQWVRLSYIANPEQPDVYSLRRGDF